MTAAVTALKQAVLDTRTLTVSVNRLTLEQNVFAALTTVTMFSLYDQAAPVLCVYVCVVVVAVSEYCCSVKARKASQQC
jgi:hypothetical protein